MQALRNASVLARLVLAWFALAIGVAVASPLVKPAGVELICSGGGGMKLLPASGSDGAPAAGHVLDCPLCASLDATSVASHAVPRLGAVAALVIRPVSAERIVATAGPAPARGPPALLALN